jgi:hypothetical protein
LSIPIDSQLDAGFGTVTIPGDANPVDNSFYFVFSKPTEMMALVVADNPEVGELLRLSWEASNDERQQVRCQVVLPTELATVDWQRTSVVAWQSTLPSGEIAARLKQLTDRGGVVLFLPPSQSTAQNSVDEVTAFGTRWLDWTAVEEGQSSPWRVADWRNDSDLLRHSTTGSALPLNDIRIHAFRRLAQSDLIPLATLDNGQPLLVRTVTQEGAVYFCSTLPTAQHSNLIEDGVVLYVMMQRALEFAVDSSGNARMQYASRESPVDLTSWQRLDSQSPVIESERHLLAGAYGKSGMLLAINRSPEEDNNSLLTSDEIDELFQGTNFQVVQSTAEQTQSLASELWRWFVVALVLSLLVEAWMTLPRKSIGAPTAAKASYSYGASPPANPMTATTWAKDARP